MNSKSGKGASVLDFLVFTLLPIVLSGVVSLIIPNMNSFYADIKRPFFSPPGFVFPIVWTILYLLMGYASYRIYRLKKQNIDVSSALFVYFIQLSLNILWPIIFFGLRLYGLAFIELVILIIFIMLTIYRFYKKDGIVSLILLPHIFYGLFMLLYLIFTYGCLMKCKKLYFLLN